MKARKVKIMLAAVLAFAMMIGTSTFSSFAEDGHSWAFTPIGDTVKIECMASHECDFKEEKEVVVKPEDVTEEEAQYNGQEHHAVVEGLDAFDGTDVHLRSNTILYSKDSSFSSLLSTAPVEVGTYYARANIDFDYNLNPHFATLNTQFQITAKKVKVTWTPEEFVYKREPQGPVPSVPDDAFVAGEDVQLSDVVFKNEDEEVIEKPTNAGKYTAEVKLEGADKENYELQNAEVDFEIQKKPIDIQWEGDQFTYNGERQVPQETITEPEDADMVDITYFKQDGEHEVPTPIDADQYLAIASLKDADNFKWTPTSETQFPFVIDPMEIPVQWGDDTTFEYDGEEHAPSVSIVPNYTVRGDDVDVIASKEKAVGTHTSTAELTGSKKTNYFIKEGTETCDFEITAKAVTIVWSNTELTYNGQVQFPTAKVNQHDLVPGEICEVTTIESFSDEACTQPVESKDVNEDGYYAKASGLSNDNYVLKEPLDDEPASYITHFIIKPFALSVKFSDNSFDYDGEEHMPTAELQTAFNGDDVEPVITISGPKATDIGDGILAAIHAGTYTATVDKEEGLTGESAKNYTLKKDKYTYQFKINPKRVSISWMRPANNEYGDIIEGAAPVDVPAGDIPRLVFNGKHQAPFAKVADGELIEGDECFVTVTAPLEAVEVGEYEAQKINMSNPDYTADDSGTSYEIVSRPVKLLWDAKEAIYNGEKQERSVEITNLQKNNRNVVFPCEVTRIGYSDGHHFGKDGEDDDEPDYDPEDPKPAEGSVIEQDRTPIDAGTYIMTAYELSDPYNYALFVLDPETNLPTGVNVAEYDPLYTIHQYKIQKIDWTGYQVIYNASNQLPVAKVGDLQGPDTDEECKLILTNEEGVEDYKGECNAGNGYTVYILDKDGIRNMNYIFDYEKMEEENYGWHKFIIKKRPLTITAKSKTITYGDKPANNGVKYSGLINGNVNKDKKSDGTPADGVIKGKITYTYTYQKYGKYGTYKIIPGKSGEVTSDNYQIKFVSGKLKVKDKIGKLVAKGTAKGQTAVTIKWNKVTGAKKYVIYWAKCNKDESKVVCKKIKTVKASKRKFVKSKLKKNFKYKFCVAAFDAKGKQLARSYEGHFTTGNVSGKFTNPKKLTVNKKKVNLKVGKTFKIKAKIKKVKSGKKLFTAGHAPKLRYMSYSPAVATVSKSGVIKAKAKGFCRVYVQAVNGMWKVIEVNVK